MNQINQQNNNNNIIVLNDIKTSFNNDFAKQKNFTFNIYSIITITSAGIKELNPSLENINNILPYLIEQLGIPFCDLLNEANIIKYYFNNYIITKSGVFKKIIFAFIEVFNYQSADKTPGDILIQFLSSLDNTFKEIEGKKRTAKNDLEELYEKITIDYMRAPEENKLKIKNELLEKINELEKTNNYPVSTWQYFKEKITSIENNNKIIDINDIKCVNIFNFINQLINNFQSLNYFLNSPNNIINSNNEIPNEELNEIKGIPLKDRKFLYKEEQLMEEENKEINIERKEEVEENKEENINKEEENIEKQEENIEKKEEIVDDNENKEEKIEEKKEEKIEENKEEKNIEENNEEKKEEKKEEENKNEDDELKVEDLQI